MLFRLSREGVGIRMPALIPSLWFEAVRFDRLRLADRRSGGSISPSCAAHYPSGFQSGTIEIGSAARLAQTIKAMRSAQPIKAMRSAQIGDPLREQQWQRVDEKELRRR